MRTKITLHYITLTTVFLLFATTTNGQRVAPGVPPQHYQQVPVQQQQHPPQQQQHYQQQQQQQMHVAPGVSSQHYQQQQPNVQYQQAPVQQQQQQYQQQQVPQAQQMHQQQQQPPQPPQHQGHHQQHGQPQQILSAANIEHERAHIQEHIQVPIDTSKMSEAELQFHYFKMHDSDNNNKLDGCELIKSLIHWHDDEKKPNGATDEEKKPNGTDESGTGKKDGTVYTDKNLEDVIDYVLKTMDLNNDGYVDYTEYRKSEDGAAKGAQN